MELIENIFVLFVWGTFFLVVIFKLIASVRIVAPRHEMIVERLGRYYKSIGSGFHILMPFFDRVVASLDMKEETLNVPPQECFTEDEVKVMVDGVIYLSVVNAAKAYYGVTNYKLAAMQLAQTTTRSVIGTLSLDRTFEERIHISKSVVEVLDLTSEQWGIKVHRYEIKNIQPPDSVRASMESQVRAERERKAILAKAQGEKSSRINNSEGIKADLINTSEGEMQRRINEAQGAAARITSLADAMGESIEKMAAAISEPNGNEALRLQLAEELFGQLGTVAKKQNFVVAPLDLMDLPGLLNKFGLDKAS